MSARSCPLSGQIRLRFDCQTVPARLTLWLAVCLSLLFVSTSVADVHLSGDSVFVVPTDSIIQVPFFISTDQDSVAAFTAMIALSNPELAIVDSLNAIDLTGSGLTTFSAAVTNLFGWSTVLVHMNCPPPFNTALPPDSTIYLAFTLNLRWVTARPDTFCGDGRELLILPGNTSFSSPRGVSLAATLANGAFLVMCPPCGDADNNDVVTISDVVYLISYVFTGGPPPTFPGFADADCNGIVNISDAVYLIQYIFAGGNIPCADCQLR